MGMYWGHKDTVVYITNYDYLQTSPVEGCWTSFLGGLLFEQGEGGALLKGGAFSKGGGGCFFSEGGEWAF